MITVIRIDDKLALHSFILNKGTKKPAAPPPTHHVAVIDCSGSMGGELPQVAQQLCNKLPSLVSPSDFVTLIWFSGRGQCGRILDHEPVAGLKDVARIQTVVKKWLQPVGMTGFKDPADLARESFVADKPGTRKNLLFMSDGCENQSSRDEVLRAFSALGKVADTSTIVEYGYYADRGLLTKLAEASGGSVVLARDFPAYDIVVERAFAGGLPAEKLVETKIPGAVVGGVAFTLSAETRAVRVFPVSDQGMCLVPEGVPVSYLRDDGWATGTDVRRAVADDADARQAVYGALSLLAYRMQGPLVRRTLFALGDMELVGLFGNCFGKQRYQDFVDASVSAALSREARLSVATAGVEAVLGSNRPTVLDLLAILQEDSTARILLDHPSWSYERISRGRDDAHLGLRFTHHSEKIAFIRGVTWNETRPNVSVLTEQFGTVEVPVPDELKGRLASPIATRIYRNYALVKDGIIHMETLPLKISEATRDRIVAKFGREVLTSVGAADLLDLRKLGVCNWNEVSSVSAKDFFTQAYQLHTARSEQKVLKALIGEKDAGAAAAERSLGLSKTLGEEVATYLRSVGVTDNGFAPVHTKQAAVKDVYNARALVVRMKGFSSLPTVKEVRAMKKIAPRAYEMNEALRTHTGETIEVLQKHLENTVKVVRALTVAQARTRFSIIVGQVWFKEFASLDENTMKLIMPGVGEVEFSATLEEEEVEV